MGPLTPLYFEIGNVGAVISPAVAVALIFIFLSVRKDYLPVVPVVACPLIFWLVFEYLVWQSAFSNAEMVRRQFDDYTGDSVRWLFLQKSLILSGAGLVIGLASGKLLSLAEGLIPAAAPREHIR
jgi:hypothetical protein